ncbi:MAG: hypothetical protein NTW21_31970 [Verrucomicrobia bacterium]|nr:hypothetical protein [Verrucomicrobiota bacterium]
MTCKYTIDTSPDGKAWTSYVAETSAFPVTVSPHQDSRRAQAAFVRITLTGCTPPENGAGIHSFEVY